MLDTDDLDPHKTALKPRDLSTFGVQELEAYIANLEAEIARARELIGRKQDHRLAVESLFKSG